jgi:type II secretory pathway pseudopilin PulG
MNHSRPPTPRSRHAARPAFTLVELMISIALALMLIYGIAQVFKMSGDTIGAQQALSSSVRDQRAASPTFIEDFRNSVPDSPLFLISNRIAYGYDGAGTGFKAGWKDAEEERDGSNPDPTVQAEINGSAVPNTPITGGTDRTPRLDRLAFFTRNLYRRQTAEDDQMFSAIAGTEAYVWYGHVALPGGPTGWRQPQQQYGSERVLGRVAILMKDRDTALAATDRTLPMTTVAGDTLAPLSYTSGAYQSYRDVGLSSIDEWRASANFAYGNTVATPGEFSTSWFRPMEDPDPATGKYWRAWCQPTVTRPITQQKLSQTAPFFVGNCTQFIVEYAGDFLDQREGDATDPVPGRVVDAKKKKRPGTGVPTKKEEIEGDSEVNRLLDRSQIDYVIDTSADPADPPNDPTKWVRRVRWYGLPRDVSGDGLITINDVLPLSDVMAYYDVKMNNGDRAIAPWEADLPMADTSTNAGGTKQGLLTTTLKNGAIPPRTKEPNWQQDYSQAKPGSEAGFLYTCAWHNDAPLMIRITMKVDDPTGKLKGGQWYQYILSR